jgi:hypothetical protein
LAKIYNLPLLFVLIGFSVALTGCATFSDKPRPRPGSYASATVKVCFNDCNALGHHDFGSFIGERDGIVYTNCGGHIDIAHLRIAADNVYYLHNKVSRLLEYRNTDFTCKLNTDSSVFDVSIKYPQNFCTIKADQQKKIIDEVSLEAAQYVSWQMVSWHEVSTWFGMKLFGVVPQFQSAFSWEDNYSNLLGITLAGKAIRHPDQRFNDDMTVLLKDELNKLGPRSAEVARYASEKMRGKWYTGYFDVHMLLRSIDLGLNSGYVTPVLVPGICPNAKPVRYPIPKLEKTRGYGFTVNVEITPRGAYGQRCLQAAHPDGRKDSTINPAVDLPAIMKHIEQEARQMGFTVAS